MESPIKRRLQTLHCHTNNSDGDLTHEQVLDICARNNIGVVAFTDHDTLPSREQIEGLKDFRTHPTKYIWGIEITSGYPKEIENKETKMFHIVGLFVNPDDKTLTALTTDLHHQRRKKIGRRIREFAKLGFKITEKEVFATVSGHGIPTTLNLVNVLETNQKNKSLLRRYLGKMRRLGKADKKIARLYQEMVADERGDKQKYFNIFIKDESPYKIILPDYQLPDMDSIVKIVRAAEGLSVLAHWSFDRENVDKEILERIVKEKRVDGLETVYDLFLLDKPVWKRRLQRDRSFLRNLAQKHGLFISGGVDAHRAGDFELFALRTNYNRETVGMVEKIIDSRRPNLTNSSLCPSPKKGLSY